MGNNTFKGRDKYKPAVSKRVLLFLAGGLWICVGSMLLLLAVFWLLEAKNVNFYVFAGAGFLWRFLFTISGS